MRWGLALWKGVISRDSFTFCENVVYKTKIFFYFSTSFLFLLSTTCRLSQTPSSLKSHSQLIIQISMTAPTTSITAPRPLTPLSLSYPTSLSIPRSATVMPVPYCGFDPCLALTEAEQRILLFGILCTPDYSSRVCFPTSSLYQPFLGNYSSEFMITNVSEERYRFRTAGRPIRIPSSLGRGVVQKGTPKAAAGIP